MYFRDWIINEIFGNKEYKLPEDKEQRLYDFYMLSLLREIGKKPSSYDSNEDKIDYTIHEIAQTLLPNLKQDLLNAVFFSLSAEFRHVLSQNNSKELINLAKELGDDYAKIMKNYINNYSLYKDPQSAEIQRRPKNRLNQELKNKKYESDADIKKRKNSYYSVLKSSESKPKFVKLMEILFDKAKFISSYGGSPWRNIATAWLKLYEAKSEKDLFTWIDHIYDLQHNTDTVFNKLQSYLKDKSYDWLKKALDNKFSAKEMDFIDKVSPMMRKIALRAIKAKTGQTYEQYIKSQGYKSPSSSSKMTVDSYGNKVWRNDKGQFHREDGPAIEMKDGSKSWIVNDQLHREDGPAVEHADGKKEWWINGKQLTEEEFNKQKKSSSSKMTVDEYGNKIWQNDKGQLHREDGPAVEYANGDKSWYKNGEYHRLDGPAIEYANGSKIWYKNGEYHREDGPAIEFANGTKYWYKNGKQLTEEEFNKQKKSSSSKMTVNSFGDKIWQNEKGQFHREDGPAIEYANGSKYWYKNGQLHREDGPAVEYENGTKYWYINGKKLTEEEFNKQKKSSSSSKMTVDKNGNKQWRNDKGELHREDGPAIEYADGTKVWYRNGEYHRENGPAIEEKNGAKEWWLKGKRHREDGPAIEFANGTKYWYVNGKELTEEEFNKTQKAKKLFPKTTTDQIDDIKKTISRNPSYKPELIAARKILYFHIDPKIANEIFENEEQIKNVLFYYRIEKKNLEILSKHSESIDFKDKQNIDYVINKYQGVETLLPEKDQSVVIDFMRRSELIKAIKYIRSITFYNSMSARALCQWIYAKYLKQYY